MIQPRKVLFLPGYYVREHHLAIGRMTGEHLIAHGFQDIGYFYYDPEVANSANETERSAGLRQAVEKAGRHLAEYDVKIQGLATDLGFRSASYFSTVFLQETGLTPAEFRRRARIRPPT